MLEFEQQVEAAVDELEHDVLKIVTGLVKPQVKRPMIVSGHKPK